MLCLDLIIAEVEIVEDVKIEGCQGHEIVKFWITGRRSRAKVRSQCRASGEQTSGSSWIGLKRVLWDNTVERREAQESLLIF